jgi:tetratricopeptide (TPR) repeat protein
MIGVIFENDVYRIEHHRCADKNNNVVFTFTPFMFSDLNVDGFGVKFLLSEGYDVICFKCIRDSWFQNLPPHAIKAAAAAGRDYSNRLTYGSSMGGFAAIAFADRLSAVHAIAISPQYSIKEKFDTRWSRQAAAIPRWKYEIEKGSCTKCRVTLLYDDRNKLDNAQITKIVGTIKTRNIVKITAPFSGHPTGHFLDETNQMSGTIRRILRGETDVKIDYRWSLIRRSYLFYFNLGIYAEECDRNDLAILCFTRCYNLIPWNIEYLYRFLPLLIKLGRVDEANQYCDRLFAKLGENAEIRFHLCNILSRANQTEKALIHGRRALELDPDNANYKYLLRSILKE